MREVSIIYRNIPQYRKEFYNQLRDKLREKGINLSLIYGQASRRDILKEDTVDLAWATKIKNFILYIGRYEIFWQPVFKYIKKSELVIIEQASKLLINYPLVLLNVLKLKKVAFWGQGKNFQEPSANAITEKIKAVLSRHVHWWFVYNDLSAKIVSNLGYPRDRITSVQNSIDTKPIVEKFKSLTNRDLKNVYDEIGILSKNVGIYVGGMYPEKRIPFLLEAARLIRKRVPDFEIIFIGSGIDKTIVENAANTNAWIHYLGPKFDIEKVQYFAVSKVFLLPGAVGLGILDAFALETPLITTKNNVHGPEISYLQNGINGIIIDDSDDVETYADIVSELLLDEAKLDKLIVGCRESGENYSLEQMVERFAKGILDALNK